MKITSLQYGYHHVSSFKEYASKIESVVALHAKQETQLLLFPEYAGMEMLSFMTLDNLLCHLDDYLHLFQMLSQRFQLYICSGSVFTATEQGIRNRAYLFSPDGEILHQDKCILTPYERKENIATPGDTLQVFCTELGKVGICICYDIEFPALARSLVKAGADLILVPSYTSSMHGYHRVFTSCRARAMENQCYIVQSATVGFTDEMTYGAAAICGPIDRLFPEDGVLALETRDIPGAVSAHLDFSQLAYIRKEGETTNYEDLQHLENNPLPLLRIHK